MSGPVPQEQRFRIFILGAGFSRAAGLPTGMELSQEILKRSKKCPGGERLREDLSWYRQYSKDCFGREIPEERIDFERFMGFLDIEHSLGLRGSDTWSRDGNEGQVIVKTLIGEILTERLPSEIPSLYLEFARRLQPSDYVLTFNYDIILERALDAVGKPYRLFPSRYVDTERFKEVIVLKMHGSIDWFDKSFYLQQLGKYKRLGCDSLPPDVVFNSRHDLGLSPLVNDKEAAEGPMKNIFRVRNIETLYKQRIQLHAQPVLLTPSINKALYVGPMRAFWNGLGQSGMYNFGMAIIGYSLPEHDDYARQVIYSLVRNYQKSYSEKMPLGLTKTPIVLVDKRDEKSARELKQTYRFLDPAKTCYYFSGFNESVLEQLFAS